MNAETAFSKWESAVRWLRDQSGQNALVRECYYDDPLLAACERYRQSAEWAAVRDYLAGYKGCALDIGAGRGIASYALAHEGFEITALEPNPSHLVGGGAIRSMAIDAQLPITVVQEFSEELPFADRSFDVAFAREVLHHTQDLEAACRQVYRVLKPGGRFIAVREHVISKPEDLGAFFNVHPLHKFYGGENAFLLKQYVGALTQAGFTIRAVLRPLESPINYFPHTLESLRAEIVARMAEVPGSRAVLNAVLAPKAIFSLVLRILHHVDKRPGRLYSFICDRS